MKKKIIIAAAVTYALALGFLVLMYYRTEKSIEFYDSSLAGFSQPLSTYSIPVEEVEARFVQTAAQIKGMDTVLTRKPSSLDIGYEILELAKKHGLETTSLTYKGEKKQTIVKMSYTVQAFAITLSGPKQNTTNLVGDLQNFKLGLLLIESVTIRLKKDASQADISFAVYSRDAGVIVPDIESVKGGGETANKPDARSATGRQ